MCRAQEKQVTMYIVKFQKNSPSPLDQILIFLTVLMSGERLTEKEYNELFVSCTYEHFYL